MLKFRPNKILLVIRFNYRSKQQNSSIQGVPNEIRRAFMGLEKGSPNVPKNFHEFTKKKDPILSPLYFSLIKEPIIIDLPGGKSRSKRTATGAMILYKYMGLFQDIGTDVEALENYLNEKIFNKNKEKPYSYVPFCSGFNLIIGKDWDDIKD